MKDRVPLYPGRVKMVPVSGQENVYDMTRADQPTQQGDPLNKATLLKDATAALFGLTPTAVPNDVFSFLGKYNLYWWKRRTHQSEWVTETENITVNDDNAPSWFVITIFDSYGSYDVRYANNIQVSDSGEISLVNPQTVSVDDRDSGSAINIIAGKYCAQMRYDDGETGKIFFIPSGQSGNKETRGNTYYWYFSNTRNITSKFVEEIGEWEYVQSSNREAYPDRGISGGYEYQFLGVPFDNAVTSVKIETGSYVGTGTFGASNPNSLTFGFVPKMVALCRANASVEGDTAIAFLFPLSNEYQGSGAKATVVDSGISKGGLIMCKVNDKTVSWYGSSQYVQLNNSSSMYTYLALG